MEKRFIIIRTIAQNYYHFFWLIRVFFAGWHLDSLWEYIAQLSFFEIFGKHCQLFIIIRITNCLRHDQCKLITTPSKRITWKENILIIFKILFILTDENSPKYEKSLKYKFYLIRCSTIAVPFLWISRL